MTGGRRSRIPGWPGWLCGAACVLALGAPAAAEPTGPSSIIGGTTTTPGQYPSVVAIRIGTDLCTGTLVTPVWVLTAGHCVDPAVVHQASQDQVTAATRVLFNTLDALSDDGTVVRASDTIKNPLFDAAHLGSHDIGLIKLATPVTDVEPSPVNFTASKAAVGVPVTMVGYGSTEHGGQGTVGVEFELTNHISVSCPTLGIGADANLLCFSQADNTGTCLGDSGGPSFATIDGRRTVVGVTSFGDQQCAEFGAATRTDIEQAFVSMVAPEVVGCQRDSECPSNKMCFARRCIALPFSPTGLGTECASAADCESSQCAESSQDGKRCSMTCSVSDESSCPNGFDCLRANGDVGACWPNGGGGCCDAGSAGGPATMLVGLAAVGLGLRRRRR
jgi:uncharacterized protein (TIGR03382 family)